MEIESINKKLGEIVVPFFLGRLQPLTKKHVEIFKLMYERHQVPIEIFIIKSNNPNSPFKVGTIMAMLSQALDFPWQAHVLPNGFIGQVVDILRSENKEPIALYCGTDRKETYQKQIDRYKDQLNLNIEIVEITRIESNGVSATKAREALKNNNITEFKHNTDPHCWSLYEDLRKEIELGNT